MLAIYSHRRRDGLGQVADETGLTATQAEWVADLGATDSRVRLQAVMNLGRFRVAAAIPALLSTVRLDGDALVRSTAASAVANSVTSQLEQERLAGYSRVLRSAASAESDGRTRLAIDKAAEKVEALVIKEGPLPPPDPFRTARAGGPGLLLIAGVLGAVWWYGRRVRRG